MLSVYQYELLLLACFVKICISVEPLTMAVGAGVGLGALKFNALKDQTYCRFYECCDERSIPADINKLQESLEKNLFGQHIVQQQLIPALQAHFSVYNEPRKPLVISFHGPPGTGKNFVAEKIAEALYSKGLQSKFVHTYYARSDFNREDKVHEYQDRLNAEVRESIAHCSRSLFIFDEVNHMPPGVFESISSLLDYNALVDGQYSSKAIFILLSNIAGVQISNRLAELTETGGLRDQTKLSDFEHVLEKASYNLKGGLQKSALIETHVIDYYVPFLPLEKLHVSKCIIAESRKWSYEPGQETIDMIIEDTITFDPKHSLFSTTGCKRLDKKVAVVARTKRKQMGFSDL